MSEIQENEFPFMTPEYRLGIIESFDAIFKLLQEEDKGDFRGKTFSMEMFIKTFVKKVQERWPALHEADVWQYIDQIEDAGLEWEFFMPYDGTVYMNEEQWTNFVIQDFEVYAEDTYHV